MSNQRTMLALICVPVATVVALYVGYEWLVRRAFSTDTTITTTVSPTQLAECAKLMKLTFPPSTRPLGLCTQGGFGDDFLCLKVELNRGELRQFIDASAFAGQKLACNQLWINRNADLPWWNIDDLEPYEWQKGQTAFLSDQARLPDAEGLGIVIDTRREDVVTIYLEWFRT